MDGLIVVYMANDQIRYKSDGEVLFRRGPYTRICHTAVPYALEEKKILEKNVWRKDTSRGPTNKMAAACDQCDALHHGLFLIFTNLLLIQFTL